MEGKRKEEGLSAITVIAAKKFLAVLPRWAGAERAYATLSGTGLVQDDAESAWGCSNWPAGKRDGDVVTDWGKSSLNSGPPIMLRAGSS